jgi:hypothetical protein
MLAVVLAVTTICGSYDRAEAVLGDKIRRFVPGKTFAELRQEVGDPAMNAENWGVPPREDLTWLLGGTDESASVGKSLDCDFNEADVLVVCRPGHFAARLRVVTVAAFDQVKKGDSRSSVVSRLCTPERTESAGRNGQVLHYTVALSPDAPWSTCGGRIRVMKSVVRDVSMRCL